jgi:hypothetical protein
MQTSILATVQIMRWNLHGWPLENVCQPAVVDRYAKGTLRVSVVAVATVFFCVVLACATAHYTTLTAHLFWAVLLHHYCRYATALLAAKKAK